MPLQMGGVETERAQRILWDPNSADELLEANDRIESLTQSGFEVQYIMDGEARLMPPPMNPNKGYMRILSENGDDRVVWDRTVKDQVKEAFKKFTELVKKGYTAYVASATGARGHKITEFNPGLQEIILIPKTVKG